MDKLDQLIAFSVEIDKMKSVYRRTLLVDRTRTETDAEHSWHLATMVMLFRDYADKKVNVDRCVKMALVHDLVEVYAGDTFAYDEVGYLDKEKREKEAADKLFSQLPDNMGEEYRALWEEFDQEETPDAIYTCALDRLQPLLNNYNTEGHTWKDGTVTKEKVLRRMQKIKQAMPPLWEKVEFMLDDSVKRGLLKE